MRFSGHGTNPKDYALQILVLDLGKFNTRSCVFNTNTRKHAFQYAPIIASSDPALSMSGVLQVDSRGSLLPKATEGQVMADL